MAEFPAMPLYTDALIADTAHLSDAEFGLYMRLLIQMWRSPTRDGTIPNDPEWLAKRFNKNAEGVESEIAPLISEFCINVARRRLTQRRLQRELLHAHEYRKRQSENAKRMWNKKKRGWLGISESSARAISGLPMPAHALHPNPIEEENLLLTKSLSPAKEKEEAIGTSQTEGEETIQVSSALAATKIVRRNGVTS